MALGCADPRVRRREGALVCFTRDYVLGSIRFTGYPPRGHRSRETNCHSMRRGTRRSLPQFDIGTLEFKDAERVAADKKAILFDDNTIGVKTRSVWGVQLVGGFAIS